jgi:hypothetical protein
MDQYGYVSEVLEWYACGACDAFTGFVASAFSSGQYDGTVMLRSRAAAGVAALTTHWVAMM